MSPSRRKFKAYIGPILAVVLFSAAIYVLNRELESYKLEDVVTSFRTIPADRVIYSGIYCILSYVVLTFYDVLALKYVGEKLAYYRIALASFIGYTFSHNLGFSVITGGAARYRLFSSWGLTVQQIAQAILFSGVTFWFGFALLAGVIFIFDPPVLPESIVSFHPLVYQGIGVVLIAVAVGYILLGVFSKRPLKIKDFEFRAPKVWLSAVGSIVSAVDWLLAAAVAYCLLPPGKVGFWQFVGVFQAAQVLAMLSFVPAGAGIFEILIITYYGDTLGAGELLGILLAYRVIYYLIPLAVSMLLFAARELKYRWVAIKPVIVQFKAQISRVIPGLASVLSFCAGLVMLISGATPGIDTRLQLLDNVIPLPLLEASHLTGSIVGLTLLILSRGLKRRLDSAYVLTMSLLLIGGFVSILKGLDYEEAALLITLAVIIAPFREAFYRKSAFLTETFTPGWITMIVIVIVSITWIVFFSYKHVEYSSELWWNFSLEGDAPRSLRSLVGVAALFLAVSGFLVLRPVRPTPSAPTQEELDLVASIIKESPKTYASLALLGDKSFIFSDTKRSFLMFSIEGRSWISLSDPVGVESESAELIWKFKELADEHDGYTAFYQIHSTYLPYYIDAGFDLLKIGEEAIIDLSRFSIQGNSNSGFRSARNRAKKDGWEMEIIPSESVLPILPRLREISDSWLNDKNTKEKRFSLGFFNERYLLSGSVAVIKREEKIVAFANVLVGCLKEELSVDLMRHTHDAFLGVMDFLFVELLLWGKENGFKSFNMGMAPFSGLEAHRLGSSWSKLGSMLFRHGEHFYNFQGIRKYKEKFKPEWQPKYLAAPGGFELARVITNLATLISGGVRGLVSK